MFKKLFNKFSFSDKEINEISKYFSNWLSDHLTTLIVVSIFAFMLKIAAIVFGFEFMVFALLCLLFLKRT